MGADLERYHLQLERVRYLAMLACETTAPRPDDGVVANLREALARLEQRLDELATGRIDELARRLALDPGDVELIWVAVAVTADPRVLAHAQVLGGGDARRGLSLALHATITGLDAAEARELALRRLAGDPLLDDHILEWSKDVQSTSARGLVAPARTIAWLAGDDRIDAAMFEAASVAATDAQLELDVQQREVMALLPKMLGATPSPLVIVEGAVGTGRRTALARAAATLGRPVVALDATRLPHGLPALEGALIGLRRECLLRDAIPVIAELDELGRNADDRETALRVVARALDAMPGPVAVTVRDPSRELRVARPMTRVRWATPDAATRRSLWQHALGADASAADLDEVALRYRLGAGGIQRAVASARVAACGAPLRASDVISGVRTHIAEQLGELAVRQEVTQSWDDLVLAPDISDQVGAVVSRVRHAYRVLEEWGFSSKLPKGTGVAALFSGPPGTGKTMVAGLIARELDLELYQVDLSKVVSKWVGETEKQLARIFEAADAGHALLLFDEADALFAKRTDVKSAVDRYANLEVNYLLQRIESFGGVTILTTNLDVSIDPALRRRLAASIAFWPPDQREREALWERMLLSRAPRAANVDVRELADTFDEMTGANIRNAVLAAAFLAASEDSSITQAHLVRAARGEYASMGRVLGKK
jgi:ATPase family protein associated with various cellular activities (AAA)